MNTSLFNIAIMLALVVGIFAEPVRVYQGLTGRLGRNRIISEEQLGKARRMYYWAFPCWLGLLWAWVNIELLHNCSGDTCIGYSLPALPFPFLYGLAELRLQLATERPAK